MDSLTADMEGATQEGMHHPPTALPATRAARAALRLQAALKSVKIRDAPLTLQQAASTKEALVLAVVVQEEEGAITGAEPGTLQVVEARAISAPTARSTTTGRETADAVAMEWSMLFWIA